MQQGEGDRQLRDTEEEEYDGGLGGGHLSSSARTSQMAARGGSRLQIFPSLQCL